MKIKNKLVFDLFFPSVGSYVLVVFHLIYQYPGHLIKILYIRALTKYL